MTQLYRQVVQDYDGSGVIEFSAHVWDKAQQVLDEAAQQAADKKQRYWLYAPGENASKWDEFYEDGVMALGWDELGDLNNYQNKEEIVARLQEIEATDSSKKNDATANDQFKNSMAVGGRDYCQERPT